MTDRRRMLALALGTLAASGSAWWWRTTRELPPGAVTTLLRDGEHNEGFERVLGPQPFEFPRDHAAHPAFRHEWWYVTGHLTDDARHEYGFQLTFFRYALRPHAVASTSRWRSRDIVLAHFALSDITAGRFHHATRRARAALDLAGTDERTPRVWIRDWVLALDEQDVQRWLLRANAPDHAIDLALTAVKPVVLQGEQGYSRKSDAAGNASSYYSIPRLTVTGSARVGQQTLRVAGTAWLDREWGTSALGESQRGWDWFALQLVDGRELTFYRLRDLAGRTDPHSRGLLVDPDGAATALGADAVMLQPRRWWRSPRTGIEYPVDWQVRIPSAGLELTLRARVDAQEWTDELRYWEGQVEVRGRAGGTTIAGLGYLEMTGYEGAR
jgi:predicted secreted hydrolase